MTDFVKVCDWLHSQGMTIRSLHSWGVNSDNTVWVRLKGSFLRIII